ncbi:putative reverse transcriptase domain, reverse transcriptase zinc-binding domain protein [Tanacetum coccineum]
MELINLFFADDLFLFAHGDVNSARVIIDTLDEFKLASGLTPSLPKSTAYFCNVLNHTKISILHVLPFEEGRLSVKYLGVPLVSSRLFFGIVRSSLRKFKIVLTIGRINLCRQRVGRLKKGRAKVSWDLVCRPRNEGGLGIRKLDLFNKALMAVHFWDSYWLGTRSIYGWLYMVNSRPKTSYALGTLLESLLCHAHYVEISWILMNTFFECDFSTHVWDQMKGLAGLSNVAGRYEEIVNYIIPFAKRRSCKSVIAKLVLSASTYYVWQERNARPFTNKKWSVPQVIEAIVSSIRLKLLSCSFKKTRDGIKAAHLWKLPGTSLIEL